MNRREVKRAPVLRFKGFTNDWEQRKLGEIAKTYSGGTPSISNKKFYINGHIPFIKSGEIGSTRTEQKINYDGLNNSSARLIETGTLLYALYGATSGKAAISPIDGAINQAVLAIIPQNNVNRFIYEWLNKNKSRITGKYLQGGQGNLSAKIIKQINIYITSKNEELKISNILRIVNKIISLQQRKNILLYKLRKSLLSTLLTDKCTPKVRFKSFLEPLKKQKLGDMAPLRGGFAFKANNYVNTGIPIIRISNILSNGSIGGNFAYYSEQSDDSNYILFNGSALIAMSGATTGKTAILDLEKKKKVYQNQRVGYFTPTKNSDYSFIKAIIKSNYFLKQLNSIMVAGAQPNVSAVDIDNFTFYFPESKKEQKYIGNNFEIINKIILLQKNRVDKLKKLKRSLLQQLFI
ncbi:restriction endonuclease subunit S [Lactobacillus amylovorus]|uniref:restriction endonuclease subunit S n=2 Tax=Lactobacillus amylovorus TaxID=1604 RepID=UPI00232A9238|nr:restriction endonuclease subunit S [Lactobacillus amylovorus]MDB6221316.1 restriction endonuclease subunit S [Lactobacillus amylovorus]